MLNLEVNLQADLAMLALEQQRVALTRIEPIHQAMAAGTERMVRGHLLRLNSRSPNTGFYGAAARSVESSANASMGLVRVPYRGIAQRYYGGTISAGRSTSSKTGQATKALAIPTSNVPVSNFRRLAPREMGLLAFVPNRHGNIHTVGYLVEGMPKVITRGPRAGRVRIIPKPGGKMLYVLRRLVMQKADPTVMPTQAALVAGAADGARSYLLSDKFM